jgi:hypothetical protein
MSMGIRRGAARPGVQVGGKSAHAPLLVPVPYVDSLETVGGTQ